MHLSRVMIDTNNRQKIRDLSHLGAYHNWVEQSFPAEISKQNRTRKLWRVDQLSGNYYLLVVSQNEPNLERLEMYGKAGTAEVKDYKPFLNQLTDGLRARFKVTLNPVVSLFDEQDKNNRGRVVPLLAEEDQLNFLLDRSEKNGFSLNENEFIITNTGFDQLKRKGNNSIRLSKATYEGILTITEADVFRKTLTEGFGKKKAYGFGMMTVIPEV
jgi:CRISPR system Cascade subunit CasE